MDEQRKIFRVLQLIARLRAPLGCTKADVARDFDVSPRTIERYILLLRDLGFEVIRKNGRFRIESPSPSTFKPEDLIVFSVEEAAIVKDALVACGVSYPLQKGLLDKLYALTDLDELSETLYDQHVSKNINHIRLAVKAKEQVLLKDYQSVSSKKISDRLVEPIRFYNYYQYLLAFEVKSQKVKQYKTSRISRAELTNKPWKFESMHTRGKVGIFGMTGEVPINVKLQLNNRARMLMEEEYPDAGLYIRKKENDYLFDGPVYSLEGIGRFVLGLLDEIKVTEPLELKEYIDKKVEKFRKLK